MTVTSTPLLNAWRQVVGSLKAQGHKPPLAILLDQESGDQLLAEFRASIESWSPSWRDEIPNAFGMNEVWLDDVAIRWPAKAAVDLKQATINYALAVAKSL